jgi:hypothetical protein
MTRPNRHRIQRQILDVEVGAIDEAPAVQQQLARPFWDRAVVELEDVFDRAAGPDALLRLDRLELNLGTIGGSDWPSEFRKKLIAELTRSLARFTPDSPTDDERSQGGPLRAEPWRLFLFFLAHGRLPWWASVPVHRWEGVLSAGDDSDWNALREAVSSDPRARARLVYSVDDDFLEGAIACWSGTPGAARVLGQLTPGRSDAGPQREWRREFWMLVLDWVTTGGFRSPRAGEQLVRDLKMVRARYASEGAPSSTQPRAGEQLVRDPKMVRARYASESAPSSTLMQLASDGPERGGRTPASGDHGVALPEPWRTWWLAQDDPARFEHAATEPRPVADGLKARAPAAPATHPRTSEKARPALEDEAIYLSGAGVILVHPFLEQLFCERDLLAGKSFRAIEARNRAVQMIGLVAFGRADVPEHELLLAKTLCDAALEEPLEPVLLEDKDVAACDALVRAVLQHWTALRSSSPEWLREQFFLRDGKLADVDSGRRLTIERRAQDVLLARLPWGFAVVALPWLRTQIFVHWLD